MEGDVPRLVCVGVASVFSGPQSISHGLKSQRNKSSHIWPYSDEILRKK